MSDLEALVIEHADAILSALYAAQAYRLEHIGQQWSEEHYLSAERRLAEIQDLIPILGPALRPHIEATSR